MILSLSPFPALGVPVLCLLLVNRVPRPVILEGSKGMAGALSGFGGVGGLGAGSAGLPVPNNQNPPGPQKDTRTRNKTKKEVGLKKQCGQKIQAISSKLTELMVLHSKVTVSPLQHG